MTERGPGRLGPAPEQVMRIGFVSTRFAGLDGVSLESEKLAAVAEGAGHDVVWFAGELGPEFRPGVVDPEAHFESPENRALQARCFGVEDDPTNVHETIRERAARLADALDGFIDRFGVEALVLQNSSTIPMATRDPRR